jgi:hypothetical protein
MSESRANQAGQTGMAIFSIVILFGLLFLGAGGLVWVQIRAQRAAELDARYQEQVAREQAEAATRMAEEALQAQLAATVAAAASDLDALIARKNRTTFRSWNGNWIGMDGDTDLTFLPGGAAHMVEYGDGVSDYDGTYSIDDEGDVTMSFPAFGHAWPVMTLRRDSVSLLLLPKNAADGFIMGNRGGVTFLSGQGSYWPFRPPGAAEKAVE